MCVLSAMFICLQTSLAKHKNNRYQSLSVIRRSHLPAGAEGTMGALDEGGSFDCGIIKSSLVHTQRFLVLLFNAFHLFEDPNKVCETGMSYKHTVFNWDKL